MLQQRPPLGRLHFVVSLPAELDGIAVVRIPTKSPGCTDMKSPGDSETMSPTFPIDLARGRGVLAA